MKYSIAVKVHNLLDGILKFPNLKSGEVGIQVGFDMSSPNPTSDLIVMAHRTGKNGIALGIDPDPANINTIKSWGNYLNLKMTLVQKGTFSEKTSQKLIMAKRASWNILSSVDTDKSDAFTDETIEVGLDTLDNIIEDLKIPIERIGHINITNNGAEYDTLLGMKNILTNSSNLALTVIAGRPGKIGEVKGEKDYKAIGELLDQYGFVHKLKMKSELLWWGLVHQRIMKGRPYKGKSDFGIIMAGKGNKKSKFFQSFS
jgi:hypothetical protein